MTLGELQARLKARRGRMTFEALIEDCGVRATTFRRGVRGRHEMRRTTALRLLPLVALVIRPGEGVSLEIDGRIISAEPATPARDSAIHLPN